MIIRFEIVFLLFSLVFSDEHIPRDVDNTAKSIPANDIHIQANNTVVGDEVKAQDGDYEPHKDSSIKSVNYAPAEPAYPNPGYGLMLDTAYLTFTTLVGKRNIDCFFYKARKTFDIDFQVLKGGDYDIALKVFDVNSKQVAFHKSAGDGTLKVPVSSDMANTDYSICLDNQQSSWHEKKVFIMIDVEGPNGVNHPDLQTGEYAKIQQHMTKLDLMNTALSSIYESLLKVEQHQERRRLVESIDRSIMESNFEYVNMWAIVQIAMMIFVAVLQLFLIRSLFDSNYVGIAKIWKKLNEWTVGRF